MGNSSRTRRRNVAEVVGATSSEGFLVDDAAVVCSVRHC